MKRIISLLTILILTLSMTGCMNNTTDVKPSFFTDGYSCDNASGYSYASDYQSKYIDSGKFLYEDICFDTNNIISPDDYPFTAISAACYDVENARIIYSKDIFEKVYPASTTKLMTALLTVRYCDLDSYVEISEDNCGINIIGAQLCGFKKGDRLTVRDLLYCLLIYSGNDAAQALAVAVSGSVTSFVNLMNLEAMNLGAKDTKFLNPHGLHDINHYTTAYDMYLIMNECLKYPEITSIIKTAGYTVEVNNELTGEKREMYMEPTNLYYQGLYKAPEGITVFGGKTGVTIAAGNCLILYSENSEGRGFITELFKCDSKEVLYMEMNELLKMCTE